MHKLHSYNTGSTTAIHVQITHHYNWHFSEHQPINEHNKMLDNNSTTVCQWRLSSYNN